jgi:hypothetical protein
LHAADRDDRADLESARWAVIYALGLATFSAHLVKVMLQAFQALFDGFLRGRELAFDGDQENQAADKKSQSANEQRNSQTIHFVNAPKGHDSSISRHRKVQRNRIREVFLFGVVLALTRIASVQLNRRV